MNLKTYRPGVSPDQKPRVVAHRGAWDKKILENTRGAFLKAQNLGAWAIEFDIHFTRDDVPVIHHDPNLQRVLKCPAIIGDCSWSELQKQTADLMPLSELVLLKNLHFMIEIKTKLNQRQITLLEHHLRELKPMEDYHLLTLNPQKIFINHAFPAQAWILVGEFQLQSYVELCLKQNLGGVAGHYLLMRRQWIQRLHKAGKKVGVGFVPNRNLFNRAWSRQVDWVFTNHLDQRLGD